MNSHFTEGLNSMIWQEHNGFKSEYKKFSKKQPKVDEYFHKLKKLLDKQFDPCNPIDVIAPGKIHHITTTETGIEFWKVEMLVERLRPNQWPRIWFAVKGNTITFLVIKSHTENYDNNIEDLIAQNRYDDIA